MSIHALLHEALKTALEGHAPFANGVTAVFDAPPVRAARPYALVEDAVLTDWGAKGVAGREARFGVALLDAGERPVRLRELMSAAEDAVLELPRALGSGWAVASLVLLRSRIVREGEARWMALSEFRVRVMRTEL